MAFVLDCVSRIIAVVVVIMLTDMAASDVASCDQVAHNMSWQGICYVYVYGLSPT